MLSKSIKNFTVPFSDIPTDMTVSEKNIYVLSELYNFLMEEGFICDPVASSSETSSYLNIHIVGDNGFYDTVLKVTIKVSGTMGQLSYSAENPNGATVSNSITTNLYYTNSANYFSFNYMFNNGNLLSSVYASNGVVDNPRGFAKAYTIAIIIDEDNLEYCYSGNVGTQIKKVNDGTFIPIVDLDHQISLNTTVVQNLRNNQRNLKANLVSVSVTHSLYPSSSSTTCGTYVSILTNVYYIMNTAYNGTYLAFPIEQG